MSALLCYGSYFEEDYIFPWTQIEYDEDGVTILYREDNLYDWWRKINNFKPSVELYDSNEYLLHIFGSPKWNQYFDELNVFNHNNPLPCELYGADADGNMILAVRGTEFNAQTGTCEFLPKELNVHLGNLAKFLLFCKEYNIPLRELQWTLIGDCE